MIHTMVYLKLGTSSMITSLTEEGGAEVKTNHCHFLAISASQDGQICQISNFGSIHARDLILVSIPRFLGTENSLGPFSDTSDRPKWPKWPFSAIYGHSWPLKLP